MARASLLVRRAAAAAVASALLLAVSQACVIAQPSGDIPRLPATRPIILEATLVPSASAILREFPTLLSLQVELADPSVSVASATFIDYNPLTGEGLVEAPTSWPFNGNDPGERTRRLNISIPPPADLSRCHTIEVVVALTLNARDGKSAHTPEEPPGGDIAVWFYNPNGDSVCPSLDGGVDAGSDADAEAGVH
ncbi:MAG: hypothetical protein JWP97_5984 [Labilithrix sp.]|nr:hypothetical protein [Labilithrix sp.]